MGFTFAPETLQVLEVAAQILGIVLALIVVVGALGEIAATFIDTRL